MKAIKATLQNKGNSYSAFKVGDVAIKFHTSPYLENIVQSTNGKTPVI